jgi:hypothetical protein
MYDAQIGRWTGVDPYDEFASPYIGMGCDPVNNIDPSGGSIWDNVGILNGLSNIGKVAVFAITGAFVGTVIDAFSGRDNFGGAAKGAIIGLGVLFAGSFDWAYLFNGSSELNFFVTGTKNNPAMRENFGMNAPNADLAWARTKRFFSFGRLRVIRAVDAIDAAQKVLKELGDNKTIGSMLLESHAHELIPRKEQVSADVDPRTTSLAIGDKDSRSDRIDGNSNIAENPFFKMLASKTTVNTKVFLGNCWSGCTEFQPALQKISSVWNGASVYGQASDNRTMSLFNHNTFTQNSYIKSGEAAWFQKGGSGLRTFTPFNEWGGVGKYFKSVGGAKAIPTGIVHFGAGASIN